MDSLMPLSEDGLCKSCQEIFRPDKNFVPTILPAGIVAYSDIHYEDAQSFYAAADAGCQLCSIVLAQNIRIQGSRDGEFSTDYFISTDKSWTRGVITIQRKGYSQSVKPILLPLAFEVLTESTSSYGHLLESCRAEPLTEFLGDSSVIGLASRWLSDCTSGTSDHEACEKKSQAKFRPKRLLDIRSTHPRLSLAREETDSVPYCALSYCWGAQPIKAVLTQQNEHKYCDHIPFDTLPRTIQDAIFITKELGIEYLWIDCLCIIQEGDEGADWSQQSDEMKDIYFNCILNISADRASAADQGFLGKRDGRPLRSIFTTFQLDLDRALPAKNCVVTFPAIRDLALAYEPLASRGWVLSERILSPRTLHFASGELFWECGGIPIASESCPAGFGTKIKSSLYADFSLKEHPFSEPFLSLNTILSHYSRMSLTYPAKDKLVALAGVFRYFEEISGHEFIAGLLKSTLTASLLWHRSDVLLKTKHAPTYRAPSWSWASMDGPLSFPGSYYRTKTYGTAAILDVWVKHLDENNRFSQVTDGAIVLRGPTIPLVELRSQFLPYDQEEGVRLETSWDEAELSDTNNTATAIFLSRSDYGFLRAILICPINEGEYWIRVGALSLLLFKRDKCAVLSQQLWQVCNEKVVTIK